MVWNWFILLPIRPRNESNWQIQSYYSALKPIKRSRGPTFIMSSLTRAKFLLKLKLDFGFIEHYSYLGGGKLSHATQKFIFDQYVAKKLAFIATKWKRRDGSTRCMSHSLLDEIWTIIATAWMLAIDQVYIAHNTVQKTKNLTT